MKDMFFSAAQAKAHASAVRLSRDAAIASPDPLSFSATLALVSTSVKAEVEAAMAQGEFSAEVSWTGSGITPEMVAVVVGAIQGLGYVVTFEDNILKIEWGHA